MSAQHTLGPIDRQDRTVFQLTNVAQGQFKGQKENLWYATVHGKLSEEEQEQIAARLQACWNACEGLKTDLLENIATIGDTLASRFKLRDQTERKLTATHEELLKAVRSIAAITTCADQDHEAMCAEIQGICRVALAKVTGGAA